MSRCATCGCQVESPFDGKTVIHAPVRCDDLLAAVKAWRTAEVHHAAITLDMRDGDEQMAKGRLDDCTRELRIAADKFFSAANADMSGPRTGSAKTL